MTCFIMAGDFDRSLKRGGRHDTPCVKSASGNYCDA